MIGKTLSLVLLYSIITSTTVLFTAQAITINATQNSHLENFNALAKIFKNCYIHSAVTAPNIFNGDHIGIRLVLLFDRFVGIDDINESFEILGSLITTIPYACLAELYNTDQWPKELSWFPMGTFDANAFWAPKLLHRNSLSETFEIGGINAINHVEVSLKNGHINLFTFGRFKSYCNFDFRKFPFDIQTCRISLICLSCRDMKNFYNISKAKVIENPITAIMNDVVPSNSIWKIVPYGRGVDGNERDLLAKTEINAIDVVSFVFTFERNAEYFVLNLFAPGFILTILQLTSFLLPIDSPDRATYSVTIMLAVFVLKSEAMTYLPMTPKLIYMNYYILGEIVYASLCATYSAFICWACTKNPSFIKPGQYKGGTLFSNFSPIGLVDLVAFILAILSLLFLNISMMFLILF